MPHPPRTLTHAGETLPLRVWSERSGVPVETIRSRIDLLGWSVERALITPVDASLSRNGRPRVRKARPAPIPRRVGRNSVLRWESLGRGFYRTLGAWGSVESEQAYAKFCSEWYATAGRPQAPRQRCRDASIAEIVEQYLDAETKHAHENRLAFRSLVEHYGEQRVSEFRPVDLIEYLRQLHEARYSRRTLVGSLCCFRRIIRWAELHEHAPEGTLGRFAVVRGVPRELGVSRPKVQAVSAIHVEQTIAKLREPWRTITQLHRLIGCRSSEICGLRADEVDRSGPTWIWTISPERNKNHWRGKVLRYYLGPRSQSLLEELLRFRPSGFVWRLRGGNGHVLRTSYATAIRRAAKAAGVPHWHPHQLRHLRAQEVRVRYESSDAAAAAIGDTREVIEEIYTDPVDSVRARIALQFG